MKRYIRKIKFVFDKGQPITIDDYEVLTSLSFYVDKQELHYFKGELQLYNMMKNGVIVLDASMMNSPDINRLLEYNDIVEIQTWYDPKEDPDIYIPKYVPDVKYCNKRQTTRLLDKGENGLAHDRLIIRWSKRNIKRTQNVGIDDE